MRRRALPAIVAIAGMIGLLGASWVLDPERPGEGLLGGVPCRFRSWTGVPCPTCGLSRSFAWMARGRFDQAARARPFGVAAFVLIVANGLFALFSLARGKPYLEGLARLPCVALAWILIVWLVVEWIVAWRFGWI